MITLPALLVLPLALAPQNPAGQHAPAHRSPSYTLPELLPRPEFWVTNGSCETAALDDDTLYIGGLFSHVGPYTGPFGIVDADSSALIPTQPKFDGGIQAVTGDNLGGWYIGGTFSHVGGASLSGLVHILPGGTIDTNFTPQIDGPVTSLRLAQGWLYVAGLYSHIGGQAIPELARIDAATGSADGSWHPLPGFLTSQNSISGLLINGNTLYAFGYFDTPAVLPRRHLAAFDLGSGVLLPWNPDPDSSVYDLIVSGSTVYVGGNFTSIGGALRNRIAALDSASGNALAFNPNANSTVMSLGLSGTTLYVGGIFTSLGGQARGRGGAINTSSSAVLAWDPAIGGSAYAVLSDILIRNGSVYISGNFKTVGGQPRWNVAQVDGITAAATTWRADAAGPDTIYVGCMANQGPLLALGGNFRSVGGAPREGAAALDRNTGQLRPWHPQVWSSFGAPDPGEVQGILPTSAGVYLGGVFASVGTSALPGMALVDSQSGAALTSFHPMNLNGVVRRILLEGNRLYCGGFFTPGSGLPNSLVTLDSATGAIVAPSLGVGGQVYDMAFSNDHTKLYACGPFSTAGTPPVTRNSVACFDALSGAVLAWNPQLTVGIATGLFPCGDSVYLAGNFGSVNGQYRVGLARVDTLNGAVDNWAPLAQGGTPTCVLCEGFSVFIGGSFNSVNLFYQPRMAALDSFGPGVLTSWTPEAAGCSFFTSDGRELVALGTFRYPDGSMRPNFAVYGLH